MATYNRYIAKRALPYIDKILYVANESVDFLTQIYRIPMGKLEFYPLGGTIIKEERKLKTEIKIGRSLVSRKMIFCFFTSEG